LTIVGVENVSGLVAGRIEGVDDIAVGVVDGGGRVVERLKRNLRQK
jgi:hypothetical protein